MSDPHPTNSELGLQTMTGDGTQAKRFPEQGMDKVPLWARVCCWAGLVIVAFGFLLVFGRAVFEELDLFPARMEVPLGRLDTIDVDRDGNIYCHSRFTDRIQIYAPDGRFIRGFSLTGGTFRIKGNQNIRASSGHKIRTYDLQGKLLGEEPYDREVHYEEFRETYKGKASDAAGNHYRIMPFATISSRVEKITPEGERAIVMSQPFCLRLFQVPFPVFLYVFLGFCLVWTYLLAKHVHKRRTEQEQSSRE